MRTIALMVALAAVALASPQSQERTAKIVGCVEKGVEAGCVMLVTDAGKKFNLIGDERPPLGTYAEVEGAARAGAPTLCMEGEPFEIKGWRKLRDSCAPEK